MPDEIKQTYVSEKTAALYLGCSTYWLQACRSRGTDSPPFYKFGGRVAYRLDEVEAWAQARKFSSTAGYSSQTRGDHQ